MLVEVARIHEESRGASIDGIVDRNHLLSILFRKAAGQWHGIADAYLKNVIGVVRQHLQIVAQHIAGTRTARNLQAHIIDDAITAKELELESKLAELFAPYQDWYPSTFNPAFAEGHRLLHHGADGTVQATQLGTVEFEYVRAIKEMILFYQVRTKSLLLSLATDKGNLGCAGHFHRQRCYPRDRDGPTKGSQELVQLEDCVISQQRQPPDVGSRV